MIFNKLYKYILVLFIAIITVFNVKASNKEQHIKIALRTIGHEFLLQLNDSTSRVLPIKLVNGRYAVKFERSFSFEPNLLFTTVFKVIEENNVLDSFIVEVEQCEANDVIHSFKTSIKKNGNIIPCKQRVLPNDCYVFYFTLIEDKIEILAINESTNSYIKYAFSIFVLVIGVGMIVYLKKNKKNSKLNTDTINIGDYEFDQKRMVLIFQNQLIELSNKETSLLSLFLTNENKVLEREYILNVVWGDEGNYIGRTLDVFISKLRKKLEADSSLKIVNVRGVGYKFVMNC